MRVSSPTQAPGVLPSGSVDLGEMANLTQYQLIGRSSSGAGAPQAISTSANTYSLLGAANYAAMRALLDLEAGTDFYSISAANAAFQAADADLTTWAGLTPSAFFQTLVDDASSSALYQTMASAGGNYVPLRKLWEISGADFNSTADQTFTKLGTFTTYLPLFFRVFNQSTSLSLAIGGVYTAASKGGQQLIANTQVHTAAAGAGTGAGPVVTSAGLTPRTETPILSLTTGQGSTATADYIICGLALS